MLRRLLKGVRGAVRPGVLVSGGVAASAVVVVVALSSGSTPTPGDCLASANCFPKPLNTGLGATGIPPGTSLTACGGSATLSTPNQTINGCTYTGSLTIAANNVTIRNSRILGSIRTSSSATNFHFTVEDSELGAASGCTAFEALVGVRNYEARRNYLHNNGDGFRVTDDNVEIEDNFVILCSNTGDHSDGIQGLFAGQGIRIHHNTIDQRPASSVTAPVFFADNSESATVTDNLLLSVGTTGNAIRLQDDASPDIGPWVATGNRMIGVAANIGTTCSPPTMIWSDNRQVTINGDYDITSTGALVNC